MTQRTRERARTHTRTPSHKQTPTRNCFLLQSTVEIVVSVTVKSRISGMQTMRETNPNRRDAYSRKPVGGIFTHKRQFSRPHQSCHKQKSTAQMHTPGRTLRHISLFTTYFPTHSAFITRHVQLPHPVQNVRRTHMLAPTTSGSSSI